MVRAILVCRIVEDSIAQNSCLIEKTKMNLKKTEWSLKREPGYDNAKRNGIENMRVWLHT